MKRPKRRSVRTETCDEDDVVRLAHMLKAIAMRTSGPHYSRTLVERAFAFNGHTVLVVAGKVVQS